MKNQNTEQGLNARIGFNGDFYHVDTMSGHGILIVDNLFESCLLSKDTTAEMLGLCLKKMPETKPDSRSGRL
ncbi:contact-dependent growth inhibition system immunity protein [Morganella morganii]|uniref:contact-dependent growth inhibition system immunity protein n=1 Tax=Morganella morganii TaxID=582 RepID=UPI0030FE4162